MKKLLKYTILGLITLFYLVVFTQCKKETKQPVKPIVEQPSPKGLMEGKYKWYAGDSATVDLVLTTYAVNCQYCTFVGYDYYKANTELELIVYHQFGQPYCIYTGGSNLDSLQFIVNRYPYISPAKVFKYVKY